MRILLLMAACAALSAQTRPEEPCSVSGIVTDEKSGAPIREATISLKLEGSSALPFITETDAGGRYEMAGIEPGRYSASAKRNGYIEINYGARGAFARGMTLILGAGQKTSGIDFKMKRHGVITGRVLDAGGDPSVGAIVLVLRSTYKDGKRELERIDDATTDDTGQYRVWGLAPGRYYLATTVNFSGLLGFTSLGGNAGVKVGDPVTRATFYPATLDEDVAEPVAVESGAITTANMRQLMARAARIRGRVIDRTGVASGSLTVGVAAWTSAKVARAVRATLKPGGGLFELEGAPTGKCSIAAISSAGGVQLSARQIIEVQGDSVEDIVLTLNPAVQVAGQVRAAEGAQAKLDVQLLKVVLTPLDPEAYNLVGSKTYEAISTTNGAFTAKDVNPERYRVSVAGLKGPWFVQSIRMGESDVMDKGLDLSAGAPGPLDIVLSDRGGAIEGSAGAWGVTVALVPQDPRLRKRVEWYRSGVADHEGKFSIAGIPPGEYKLFAWESVEDGAWMDEEFMKQAESNGKPVTVRAGGTEKVEPVVIR